MKIFNLFNRPRLAFRPIDPLGGGLREMIDQEQSNPAAINLYEEEADLGSFWRAMENDLTSGELLEFTD